MTAIATAPGPRGLFVTGTDTGVGKTFVTAAIARSLVAGGHVVGVLKPVASGAVPVGDDWSCEDADTLIAALGRAVPRRCVAPIVFEEPLAPSVAARRAGRPLAFESVLEATRAAVCWWAGQGVELLLVEGVGGLLCPLAENATVADLALALDFPLVIVARRGLGTLNHTLLTVEAARWRGLRIAGVVLNGAGPTGDPRAESTNAPELARFLGAVPLLLEIPSAPDPDCLCGCINSVDWFPRGQVSRLPVPLGARVASRS